MSRGRLGDERPTGEEMLARLRGDERSGQGKGHMRVYLGMAPGVGKTYRALEEAHRRFERGTDVAVGFVEVHGRPKTAELLEGLEIVPRLRIEYRGVVVEEMDTEAVIARKPSVAIIDELAHTNVPGSPREKRWQDIELIRDAGIDVLSTCNVQHLETVADAVETITGAPVNERLPDAVLATADEIELVDMSPRALRQRIRHGNVYPPDRARVALDRFFTEPNLMALRELSLRFVTRSVDTRLEETIANRGLRQLPPISERVLVVIDDRDPSRQAMRRGANLAAAVGASLTALVVETPELERLPFDRAQALQRNIAFATDLGADVIRSSSDQLVDGIEEVARARRITHLFLAYQPGDLFQRLARRTPLEILLERLPTLEIHLVTNRAKSSEEPNGKPSTPTD
ncbi:MAG: sensor histidine kinase KdpD [Chloroflexota bacterium]|nr:sensor histidine kinase KdpD [Chloroflexota bacterium]